MSATTHTRAANAVAVIALGAASAGFLLALVATGILFVFLSDDRLTSTLLVPLWVIGSSIGVGCSALVAFGCSVAGFVRGVRSRCGWMAAAAIPVAMLAVASPILIVGTVVGAWA
jgi:integral membrane sensor domain MASE1